MLIYYERKTLLVREKILLKFKPTGLGRWLGLGVASSDEMASSSSTVGEREHEAVTLALNQTSFIGNKPTPY